MSAAVTSGGSGRSSSLPHISMTGNRVRAGRTDRWRMSTFTYDSTHWPVMISSKTSNANGLSFFSSSGAFTSAKPSALEARKTSAPGSLTGRTAAKHPAAN